MAAEGAGSKRAPALPVDVSRETLARLETLERLARRWTRTVNLVAPSTLPDFWRRHIVDSAQLWPLRPPGARRWVDLGAGGGFPGLVLAALAAEAEPALSLVLVESDARKCAFLGEAARTLGLDVTILRRRAEAGPWEPGDVVSARALASLPKLLALAAPWLRPGGRAFFPKGVGAEAEIAAAGRDWRFTLARHRSITADDAVILEIAELSSADRSS